MKIAFSKPSLPRRGALAVLVSEGSKLSATADQVDRLGDGVVRRALSASRFTGKPGQVLVIMAPRGLSVTRLVLVGIGAVGGFDSRAAEEAGGHVYGALARSGETTLSVALDPLSQRRGWQAATAASFAFGAVLRSYVFDRYRTREKEEDQPSLRRLTVLVGNPAGARRAYAELEPVADGVRLTRDLVSEPANVLFPESLAERCQALSELGLEVEVLDEAQLRELGMGALLGVAEGSVRAPRVVVMQWNGSSRARNRQPVTFVGKGVTFDTGGISLKPAAGMEDMKWDMGGAGTVIGLMAGLAGRRARVNAVGIVGLVENMPSGSAQRPGDIVTSMSGQTIEVINTDAEGRLVLADILWYAQERFRPRIMVDLATLTGAVIVALGHENAGLFASDDRLAERLIAAGSAVGESVWRLPLADAYDKALKSDAADMKNVGDRAGGSITAAQFLKRFVKDVPWAHLDIAGVTWSKKDKATVPRGGTGFGVRLLDRLVADHYED